MNSGLAIIDSGGANIASLQMAVERLGVPADLTTDPERLRRASHVILPGVGAAADCMGRLQQAGLVDTIRELRQPLLGICVGMQLLFESSEEGDVPCLGLLPGRVRRLPQRDGLPVPHMGWNQLEFDRPSPLLNDIAAGDYVYFVHSYAAPLSEHTLATTTYGDAFTAVVRRGNVHGAQFHPERSARVGAQLLRNFLQL
ncbi:MAG TPA: imidazole glycerol phosphate synthase subunit HisH [Povalibacter sp.]|uniref:imidazole glycerol phosphate synthase subunit HisH n=1 Tax=Povalibacter sp. TaxID=1962978 RepID=UPI002C999388|nr:imidazole glycerol phosphate synthase subunit HisH [Povalibacter sp.]HMN43255.1 imidazole glycerol phosphate synthase subunit HisH [Povalibacter sp.]